MRVVLVAIVLVLVSAGYAFSMAIKKSTAKVDPKVVYYNSCRLGLYISMRKQMENPPPMGKYADAEMARVIDDACGGAVAANNKHGWRDKLKMPQMNGCADSVELGYGDKSAMARDMIALEMCNGLN